MFESFAALKFIEWKEFFLGGEEANRVFDLNKMRGLYVLIFWF